MSRSRAVLAGCGAVSAVGRGLAALDKAIAENRRALSPCARKDCGALRGEVYGAIDETIWSDLRQEYSTHEHDRAFILAAAAIEEARTEAKGLLNEVAPERLALILSTTKADIDVFDRIGDPGRGPRARHCHLAHHRLARDLAVEFGARGDVQCVSVACASGVVALAQGARLIEAGRADAAIVVGVDYLSKFLLEGFRCLGAIDPGGCRPFDAERAGMTPGEAGAAVVLARQDLAPGAIMRLAGWGSSNDANHLTGPSRDGSGMALAIVRALKKAALQPEDIDLINGHATATPFNDASEALAYRSVFGTSARPAVCASKGMFGHTFGAGGILETIVCERASRAGLRPGTPGLLDPDPEAPSGVAPIPVVADFRTALKVNAGFAGVNGAVVLERV